MSLHRRSILGGALAAPLALAATPALAEDSWEEQRKRTLLTDFAQLAKYRDDNARILAAGEPVDIVFLGDSITEGWRGSRPGFFSPGRVGRGISGQTTSQMLLRMIADVVELRPRAMHFMAGTNDIAGNTGPMTEAMSRNNVAMIADIAAAHRVRLVLASIPPAASFPWRPGVETLAPIASLNRWLRDFARGRGLTFVDYHPAMADRSGGMKAGYADDGVHPTIAGYRAMEGVLEPVLARLPKARR
ncbi:GDSL family lipase [Sphingomonas rhizophila]|uniref:GDSL family lipase n=1 Tax=Sphingomonas rhizophila TaxID=2071607 RepID=A0A7G9SBC9_9SPHN|nr:GDSL-type esterase/lipase family protein [Sphingomonas rhizophila]QNN65154.1 GDSL family lipase [Sphingomonas rhizophila]